MITEADAKPERNLGAYVSWREFLASSCSSSLALVCTAVWLHAADSLIVATMLPAIVAEIGGAGLVGWSVTLYEIGSIVAGAASALMTIRYGLRVPMSSAAGLFALGCAVSGFSPSMPLVLAGRILQGLGGGGLVAMSFIAVGVLFPRRYTARALAAVSTLWGISAFTGPLIGGLFVEYATWRWGFWFFGLQAFALATWIALRRTNCMVVEADERLGKARFPLRRLGVLCFGVILVALGGVEIELVQTTSLIVTGLICLAAFLWLDSRAADDRLLPLRPFDLRGSTGAALLMVLSLSMATIAITAFGPLLVTVIHKASPLEAGYIVACASIGWTVTAVLVSGSPERLDRLMIAGGMTVVSLSILGFLYAVPNGPGWLIAFFAAMEGGGFGMAWSFILRRATTLSEGHEVQRISGAIPTVQRLGYALGAGYIGIVANASGFLSIDTSAQAAEVARWIFLACLPFAALGMVATAAFVQNRPAALRSPRRAERTTRTFDNGRFVK